MATRTQRQLALVAFVVARGKASGLWGCPTVRRSYGHEELDEGQMVVMNFTGEMSFLAMSGKVEKRRWQSGDGFNGEANYPHATVAACCCHREAATSPREGMRC